MKIDKNLNLVLHINDIHVHHTPISYDCFKENFLLLSKTHDEIGFNASGSQIALFMLEKMAKETGENAISLLNEIKRLTNVIVPGAGDWQHIPLEVAVKEGFINEEELDNVLNHIVFFICIYWVQKRTSEIFKVSFQRMIGLWGLQETSLSCVDFIKSLPTLTETDSSTETVTA